MIRFLTFFLLAAHFPLTANSDEFRGVHPVDFVGCYRTVAEMTESGEVELEPRLAVISPPTRSDRWISADGENLSTLSIEIPVADDRDVQVDIFLDRVVRPEPHFSRLRTSFMEGPLLRRDGFTEKKLEVFAQKTVLIWRDDGDLEISWVNLVNPSEFDEAHHFLLRPAPCNL